MAVTEKARAYHDKMAPGFVSDLERTDPEFLEIYKNFAFDEVPNSDDLDDRTRFIAVLSSLIGCQAVDQFRAMIPAAMNFGVTPVEIKEIVYQAVDYCGMGRVFPFLRASNEAFEKLGVELPLPGQSATDRDTRLEAGIQAQVDIFGEGMRNFTKSGPEETRHINVWLAENCFGDYYTRGGLDFRTREMITFCFLASQGGCEAQLTAHAGANMCLGNDRDFLIKIVSQCLPYVGYPRSLNALRCVDEAAEKQKG
jgi:4-carboxymuconolactone decarboxylase